MMNHKILLLISGLVLAVSPAAFSQDYTIEWGQEEKAGYRHLSEFIQAPDGELYELFKESVNDDFQISKLDNQLRPTIIKKLKLEDENGEIIYLLEQYASEEGIYLFAQRYFNKSREIIFYSSLIDKESLEVISPFTPFKTISNARWSGTQFQLAPVSVNLSSNGMYLVLHAVVYGNNSLLWVFDRESDDLLLEEKLAVDIGGISISDDGILRYQEIVYGDKIISGPKSLKLVRTNIFTDDKQEFLMLPEEDNIDFGFMDVNKEEVYGYSCYKQDSTLNFSLINSDGNSEAMLVRLPRDLADQFVPRKDRLSWYKEPISLGISFIQKREDGSFLIVSEFRGFSLFSSLPSTLPSGITVSSNYSTNYAGNIAIISLSSEGELEGIEIIKKDQETTTSFWISYFPFMSNGVLHVIYNDLPENLTLSEEEEPRTTTVKTGNQDILLVTVDAEGQLDKGVFLPLNGDDKKLNVQGVSHPSEGVYVLARRFQNKRVLGRLTVSE